MDPDTLEVVKATAEGAAEGASNAVLQTLLAPFVERRALRADTIRSERVERQIDTLRRAYDMLDASGVPPGWVPDKTLVPLLAYASIEDDNNLRDRWAALLANAAAGDEGAAVLPAFPQILAELTAIEAQMLDRLASTDFGEMSLYEFAAVGGWDLNRHQASAPGRVHIDNLERLRLCTLHRTDPLVSQALRDISRREQEAARRGARPAGGYAVPRPVQIGGGSSVSISELGRAFVAACTPPGTESHA